jgi:putative Mg2+ transporter-C (MgtC) family protein
MVTTDTTWLGALPWHIAGQLVLAVLVGGLLGLPHDGQGQIAGLRTTMGVALGACGVMLLARYGVLRIGSAWDMAGIAAHIATGVGVLSAVVVVRSKHWERGLLTAATLWLVAALGMAVGAGQYFLAVFTALFSTLVLLLPRLRAWGGAPPACPRDT